MAYLLFENFNGVVVVFDVALGAVFAACVGAGRESRCEGAAKCVDIIELEVRVELKHVLFGH